MISNAVQLKAKVRNISGGDNGIARAYLRVFFMERFLERLSLSQYKDNFVLKGGMLVSSILGTNLRSTMDIDASVNALTLTEQKMSEIVKDIGNIELGDGVSFRITDVETIMDDFDYPGVRIHLDATLDRLKQPIKIDISTDDVITPGPIEYEYNLMFEDRYINLFSYNTETILAEKAQTALYRGLANTRMRDFYDLYEFSIRGGFSYKAASEAFVATCTKRGTMFSEEDIRIKLEAISTDSNLESVWNMFKNRNYFVGDLEYGKVIKSVGDMILRIAE